MSEETVVALDRMITEIKGHTTPKTDTELVLDLCLLVRRLSVEAVIDDAVLKRVLAIEVEQKELRRRVDALLDHATEITRQLEVQKNHQHLTNAVFGTTKR